VKTCQRTRSYCNLRLPLGSLGIDGEIILKWVLKKYYGKMWTGSRWLRIATSDSVASTPLNTRIQLNSENFFLTSWGTIYTQTVDTDIHAAMYQVSYLSVCPSLTICSISGVYVHTNRSNDMFALGQCTLFHTRSPFIALPATCRNPPPQPHPHPHPHHQIPRTVQLLALWNCSSIYASSWTIILLDISKQG